MQKQKLNILEEIEGNGIAVANLWRCSKMCKLMLLELCSNIHMGARTYKELELTTAQAKEPQRHMFSTAGLGKNTNIIPWIQSLDKPVLNVDKLIIASSLRAPLLWSLRLPQDRLDRAVCAVKF